MKKLSLFLPMLLFLIPAGVFAVVLSGNVKFTGNLTVTGAFSKSSGTFAIDDPISPSSKILYHSYVESPDVKNMYDGIAFLDDSGEIRVILPDYYDALNKDSRYQFFPLDQAMPNLYIKEEEKNNSFVIAGGIPGGRISWQITGIRHDPYILKHPIIVEVPKTGDPVKKGQCIFEPLCK